MASAEDSKSSEAATASSDKPATKTDEEGGIKELKKGDNFKEILGENDFTVVSYYNSSDETSKKIDALLDGAKSYFER